MTTPHPYPVQHPHPHARTVASVFGKTRTIIAQRLHPEARAPFYQPREDGSHLRPHETVTKRGPLSRGPNGRPLCRWCWAEIPPKKRSWCSRACVDEYLLNHDWGRCRGTVAKRDEGVCHGCGRDTLWLETIAKTLRGPWRDRGEHALWQRLCLGLSGGVGVWREWWEADHIHARVEGGPDHPSNLRTLCIPCHKARTRQQAAERAARRRSSATTVARHPDAGDIYRHRWHDRRGYPVETKNETLARLFRAELRNTKSGDHGVAAAARAERMRLLGKGRNR